MRCLSLAEVLRERGVHIRFLCKPLPGSAESLIAAHGFEVVQLPPGVTGTPASPAFDSHAECLGEDPAVCASVLENGVDWLVVDHYALDSRWERGMRTVARQIMVIDDLANRPHDADLLLDQNLVPKCESRYHGLVPDDCRCLLGPLYAMLHHSFADQACRATVRRNVRRLLLFFGGGDQENLTGRALRELKSLSVPGDVVIGSSNPHHAAIEQLCHEQPGRWMLHVQTNRMSDLMLKADLMLGTGGTAHWERCLLGLPSITVASASNQIATTEMLASLGACHYLGRSETLADGAFRAAVEQLMNNPVSLQALSQAARAIVPDARGVERVADAMTEIRESR